MLLQKIDNKIWFQLYVNLCVAIFVSLPSYVHLPLASAKEYAIYTVHFLLLQITLYGFTYLLTLNKYLFKVGFSILFILSSLVSFWVYTMDITISVDLIQISLESKPDIFFDLVSTPLVLYFFLIFLVLYSILVFQTKVHWDFNKRYKGLVFSLLAIVLFFLSEQKKYGVFKRRMPYVFFDKTKEYFNQKPIQLNEVSENLFSKNKMNIVFVLGESVRAKNMQLNGYPRATNPLLSLRKDVYSLKNIYTPNTYTAKSVPQILTSQSINDTQDQSIYSLYSVLNKANYNTVWIGNQTPEKSYRDLIYQNKSVSLIDVEHSVLSYHKKYDTELINTFKEQYQENQANFYTLHMIGSHWWYESRYSEEFKKFTPVVKTKYLPSSSEEELINSYDNTIVYLDYFLNEMITFLEEKEEETILIYLSDHGEILGEDDKWLHGQDHEASKNPAGIIWSSKKFKKNSPQKLDGLIQNLNREVSTDFLYHSVLSLIEVQSFDYTPNKSIFINKP